MSFSFSKILKILLLSSKNCMLLSRSYALIFSRESDSTIANVRPFVRSSVRLKAKPFNNLKSSSFIIHLSSFIILQSSFIILHSSFLHFATFKLFSLFSWDNNENSRYMIFSFRRANFTSYAAAWYHCWCGSDGGPWLHDHGRDGATLWQSLWWIQVRPFETVANVKLVCHHHSNGLSCFSKFKVIPICCKV